MSAPSINDYKHLHPHEHVLESGGMYIGSFENVARKSFLYDWKNKKLTYETIYSPESQERLFLEILGNAGDNVQRSKEQGYDPKHIEVTMTSNEVMVVNYGRWIPIEKNEDGIYAPELIFGVVHTSSNYGPDDNRKYIGRNGIGAKATNIFSKKFQISCTDYKNQLKYTQKWEDNMFTRHKAKIVKHKTKEGCVKIKYSPDFKRFGTKKFTDEDMRLYAAHCIEVSFTCNIPVIFNGVKINIDNVKQYAKLLFLDGIKTISHKTDEYELCIADTPNCSMNISFVNGIITQLGGVHLNAAIDCVMGGIKDIFKDSGVAFRKTDIVNHISIIISLRIGNPKFKSQTKEYLTGPPVKIELPKNLLSKIKKWSLVDTVKNIIKSKQLVKRKKTDGKNTKSRIDDINATDANNAGKMPSKCTLILTEGLSALQYAERFISHYPGSHGMDYFGTIPLKGVPLNVYNAKFERELANQEFAKIKKFLGLKEEVDYTINANVKKLRYNTIWIMVDADNDGKHIAGLLLLFFMHRFPSIVERGLIYLLRTPIVRAIKGKKRVKFYMEKTFDEWYEQHKEEKGWKFKYYKGLASSKKEDILEDFKNTNSVLFIKDAKTMQTLLKAFDKKRASDRKLWLKDFVDTETHKLETVKELDITTFIDKEMISHSFASLIRGIPQIDGFKEALRKAFYTAQKGFKKNSELKVSHLANATAQDCNYKYGEKSLCDSIAGAAMEFTGSNNESIFHPDGVIGSRSTGKNESESRYIYVSKSWWTDLIFRKEDEIILKRGLDEGVLIEYEMYYPILPTIFFNVITGISTAYRTDIPSFYPPQLAEWIIARINEEKTPELVPWFKNHTGIVRRRRKDNGFTSEGVYSVKNGIITITELPARSWTKKYIKFLISLKRDEIITEYYPKKCGETVKIIIEGWDVKKKEINLVNLGLIKRFSFKNITILEREGNEFHPRVFSGVDALMERFYEVRLAAYDTRKEMILKELYRKYIYINERMRFITDVIDKHIILHSQKIKNVLQVMKDRKYENTDHLDKVTSRHYTKEELERLKLKADAYKLEYETLKETTIKDIWLKEINEFLNAYEKKQGSIVNPEYALEDDVTDISISNLTDDEEEKEDEE